MDDMDVGLAELTGASVIGLTEQDRYVLADLYAMVISGSDSSIQFLEQHSSYLEYDITMEHTLSCSCGRFYEQHPTSIDDTVNDNLERMLRQIRTGLCRCLQNNPDPDTNDARTQRNPRIARKTLLHGAVAAGHLNIAQFLLAHGCSVNKGTNIYNYTPLFLAICTNRVDIVTALLADPNINVNIQSKAELVTPLMEAMFTRKMHFVDQLLAVPSLDLNIRNFRQEAAVIIAARMGHEKLLERILQAGAYPDAQDSRGHTGLMFSVSYGDKNITRMLLKYGASLNLRSNVGETPLLMAVSSGNYAVTEIVLDAGANPDDVSDDGFPAIMLAAYSDYSSILRLLLERGANVHQANTQDYSAVHVAAWNGLMKCLYILLQSGAHPDAQTRDRNTPLSLAAHGNHQLIVNILLQRGCNVNNADKDLDTPLHYAAFNGNQEIVEELIEHGADPDVHNRLNVSPLWNAVYRQHHGVIRELLKQNVTLNDASVGIEQHAQAIDVVTVFDTPHTPMWVAANGGDQETMILLLTAGYDVTREPWIGSGHFPGKSNEDENLRNILSFHHKTPMRLLSLCRNFFRKQGGRQIHDFVRRLEIPRFLRNYITLTDMM